MFVFLCLFLVYFLFVCLFVCFFFSFLPLPLLSLSLSDGFMTLSTEKNNRVCAISIMQCDIYDTSEGAKHLTCKGLRQTGLFSLQGDFKSGAIYGSQKEISLRSSSIP